MDALHYSVRSIASLKPQQREEFVNSLTLEELDALEYDWRFWARPEQLAPAKSQTGTDWVYWLYLAGRGSGKTRSGAEWVREMAFNHPGCRIALVAPTKADYRQVMVEGVAGILATSPDWFRPIWLSSKRQLVWPNGAVAECFSAEEPQRLRGPQHHFAWCDELCAWQYLQETWDMLMFGMRLGDAPKVYISTTPKPSETLRELMKDPDAAISRGSTYANAANLAKTFLKKIIAKYEGTRQGRQELHAEILDDLPGAMWTRSNIEQNRIRSSEEALKLYGRLKRIIVAIDPSGSDEEIGAQQGIVVVGQFDERAGRLANKFCVLGDYSMSESPEQWGSKAVELFYDPLNLRNKMPRHKWHLIPRATTIVAERNFGGNMVKYVIQSQAQKLGTEIPVRMVNASDGKHIRAAPISSLYEQNRVVHIGHFAEMEDQMVLFTHEGYTGNGSPDRVDAMVWGLTELAYPGKTLKVIQGVNY